VAKASEVMITDPQVRAEISRHWAAVLALLKGGRQYMAGTSYINETWPSIHNLCLVLAYAVLDEVLTALINQGAFNCNGRRFPPLGAKMEESQRQGLQWRDYNLVDQGKSERNKLAHEAELLNGEECIKFIEAIGAELNGWGVL
jgi:hypothetical protein